MQLQRISEAFAEPDPATALTVRAARTQHDPGSVAALREISKGNRISFWPALLTAHVTLKTGWRRGVLAKRLPERLIPARLNWARRRKSSSAPTTPSASKHPIPRGGADCSWTLRPIRREIESGGEEQVRVALLGPPSAVPAHNSA